MGLTAFVDVAIGLSLVYLGVSLFVTIFNEYLAQALSLRGDKLAGYLKELIDDPALRAALGSSPVLGQFFEEKKRRPPSYVDPGVLARLLVGSLPSGAAPIASMANIVGAINELPDSSIKKQLRALSQAASDKVDEFVEAVAAWVDRTLTMMGERYNMQMQWISLGLGLAVAAAFNVDTVALTSHLASSFRRRPSLGFSDCLVVEIARSAGHLPLGTFDRKLATIDGVERLRTRAGGLRPGSAPVRRREAQRPCAKNPRPL